MTATDIQPTATSTLYRIIVRYHTPRAYIREGSRATQRGYVHVHVAMGPATFSSTRGRTITRWGGQSLCLRKSWFERLPEGETAADLCPQCRVMAEAYGVEIPRDFRS
jgi:hypothetical protein